MILERPPEELQGLRVAVYRNLHKDCFSVTHKGIVVAHVKEIHLLDVEFRVSVVGRQRVLREQQKNIHAKVWGTVVESLPDRERVLAYYNPYTCQSFVSPTGVPLYSMADAVLRDNCVFV